MKEKINENFDEKSKNGITDITKSENKDNENASEDSLETKKKIVETITESAVKDSKFYFLYFL